MSGTAAGFIDVGFLRASVAGARGIDRPRVRLEAAKVAALVARVAAEHDARVLRTYWYDGQYAPDSPKYVSQRQYLDAIAQVPGIRARLGSLVERTPSWAGDLTAALRSVGVDPSEVGRHFTFDTETVQKGVDTLMVLDLVELSHARAYDTAVLLSGDGDLNEAVRTVQAHGRRVVLMCPRGRSVSTSLASLADEVVPLSGAELRELHREARAA